MFEIGDTVAVDSYSGVAWRIVDFDKEWEPLMYREWDSDEGEWYDADSGEGEWVSIPHRFECYMVGDDTSFFFDESELTHIADEDFCDGCGQIGCRHGG